MHRTVVYESLNHSALKKLFILDCLTGIYFYEDENNFKLNTWNIHFTLNFIIIVVVVFQGLGLLACSGFRTYFSETYESIWTVGKTPCAGDRPDARPLPTQDNTHIHASSGIRTHDPSVRAAEDST
jgi:hypothetical protein